MKVILLQDIRGLGKKGEVKEASDGHARNFLLPRGLAKPATPQALSAIGRELAAKDEAEGELLRRLREIASLLAERNLEFGLKTDEHGSVFGAVNKEMILKAMREHGLVGKERVEIKLEHPLKSFGEHRVKVDLKKGIEAELKIIVRPEAS